MWFVGLIVGALFGALLGGGWGALWGALGGWIIARVWFALPSGSPEPAPDERPPEAEAPVDAMPIKGAESDARSLEQKVAHVYEILEDIHWRLRRLEASQQMSDPSPLQREIERDGVPAAMPATLSADATVGPHSPESPVTVAAPAVPESLQLEPAITEAFMELVATGRVPVRAEDSAPAEPAAAESPESVQPAALSAEAPASPGAADLPPKPAEGTADELLIAQAPAAPAVDVASAQNESVAADSGAAAPSIPSTSTSYVAAAAMASNRKVVMTEESVIAEQGTPWWARLIEGNIVAKVGAVVLFFGVAFLLKFAYDRGMFPPPVRVLGVALAGAALFIVGWRLRATRRLYALILQGAAVGVWYLDVFFALRMFDLVGPALAFALFAALGVATTVLAVRQDARPMAVLGLLGAFLAPILARSDSGSHVVLFAYFTLLNSFVLGVSWFRAWRELNLIGFFCTLGAGLMWGAQAYRPEHFATVEPFVLIFFGMYLLIPVLFATRQPPELRGLVDGTLVFGTPASTAFIQAALVKGMPYGLAVSAGVASLLYAVLAAFTLRRASMRLLGETYVALAVGLGTLAIFFAFDSYPTFALWTLEGAAIVWVSLRQQRLLGCLFGTGLQLAAAVLFGLGYAGYDLGNPWFNDFVVGCVLIAVASAVTSRCIERIPQLLGNNADSAAFVILVWGTIWWLGAGFHVAHAVLPSNQLGVAMAGFATATFVAADVLGRWRGWIAFRKIAALHAGVLPFCLLGIGARRPLAEWGVVIWPAAIAAHFWLLARQQREGVALGSKARYAATAALAIGVATWDAAWLQIQGHFVGAALWGAMGLVAAWLRFRLRERPLEGGSQSDQRLSWVALAWGLGWWFAGGIFELRQHYSGDELRIAVIVFATLTFGLAEIVGSRLRWPALRATCGLQLVALALCLVGIDASRPLAGWGVVAWPAAIALQFWMLHRQHREGIAFAYSARYGLVGALAMLLATWDAAWLQLHGRYVGAMIWGAVGLIAAWVRFRLREGVPQDQAKGVLPLSWVALAWGMGWWFAGGIFELRDRLSGEEFRAAVIAFATLTFGVSEIVGRWLHWVALRRTTSYQAVVLATLLGLSIVDRPLAGVQGVAWVAGLGAHIWWLLRQRRDGIAWLASEQIILAAVLGAIAVTSDVAWLWRHERYAEAGIWAVVGLLAAWLRWRYSERDREGAPRASRLALIWAAVVWIVSGLGAAHAFVPDAAVAAGLGFIAVTAVIAEIAGRTLRWRDLRYFQPALIVSMVVALVVTVHRGVAPLANLGFVGWLLAFVGWTGTLYSIRRETIAIAVREQTVLGLWLLAAVATIQLYWQARGMGDAWRMAALAAGVVVILLMVLRAGPATWPWREDVEFFHLWGLGPLVFWAMLWTVAALYGNGESARLPYIPLFNPLELTQAGALAAGWLWLRAGDDGLRVWREKLRVPLAVFGFVALNVMVLRCAYHFGAVPWRLNSLLASVAVQAAFSLLWTTTAFILMLRAKRYASRALWFAGAVLLALVVGKLFFVDLANSGTVERIISFIGVGALLLWIGYRVPVPPGERERQE